MRYRSLRSRMIASVNSLTGTDDCSDAILVHERPRWSLTVAVGCVLAAVSLGLVFRPLLPIMSPAIILSIIVPLNLVGRRWIVARTGSSVVMARSQSWRPRAMKIVDVGVTPMTEVPSGGLLTKWIVLFDRRVRLPWLQNRTLGRILS